MSYHQVHFQCSSFVRSRVLEMNHCDSAAPYIKYLTLSLSWITTLQSATPCQMPQTLSSTWSSRCSWAKSLVSVCFCHFHVVQTYSSFFDHNSACSPCPCPNLISSPHALLCFRQIGNECFGANWLQYLISLLFILIVDK